MANEPNESTGSRRQESSPLIQTILDLMHAEIVVLHDLVKSQNARIAELERIAGIPTPVIVENRSAPDVPF